MSDSTRWWLAGAACLALAACGGGGSGQTPPGPEIRQIAQGTIKGSNDAATHGTYAWKGIPFAQPPVGARRWKAPAAVEAWSGTRDATPS